MRTPAASPTAAQWAVAGMVVALTAGCLAYRLLVRHRLEQTAALFIGLPAIVAILLALTPKAKSVMGIVMKGTTIALLMSGPLLGEGFICIVMAAPLFYLVAAIVAFVIGRIRTNSHLGPGGMLGLTFLPLVLLSFEGTRPSLSFPRDEAVTVVRRVKGRVPDVEALLAAPPRFAAPLPVYLRMGFPRPVEARGQGLLPGDERTIHFAGGEGRPGDLVVRVARHEAGSVEFRVVSDGSKVAHWLELLSSDVRTRGVEEDVTEVTWTIHYRRRLDPAWYFGPWERYGVGRAAGYLIDTLATPYPER